MDKRNFLEVGRYDTSTFHFFHVFWDTLTYVRTYIYAYIHTYNACIHTYIHTYIHANIHTHIHSYLDERQQRDSCNSALSKVKLIQCGVPQGSILGPLLFFLYINDISNSSPLLHFTLFADDTNVFFSHKSLTYLSMIVNSELITISYWFRANKSYLLI